MKYYIITCHGEVWTGIGFTSDVTRVKRYFQKSVAIEHLNNLIKYEGSTEAYAASEVKEIEFC